MKKGTIIFLTIDRIAYLDYLSMTVPTTITFILRSPPISYVSNIYYLPFTGVVWISSISLVILCTSFIAFILKFHWTHDETAQYLNVTDYILFAIASSCQMGSEIMSKILSARISMVCHDNGIFVTTFHFLNCNQSLIFSRYLFLSFQFVFFIALLFIYTSFTANIVALLQSTTKSIRTISDLQNPLIGIGVHDNVWCEYYYRIPKIERHLCLFLFPFVAVQSLLFFDRN